MDTKTERNIQQNDRRTSENEQPEPNTTKEPSKFKKWLNNRRVKKQTKKVLEKIRKKKLKEQQETEENRQKAIQAIIASLPLMNIEHEGESLNEETCQKLTYKEAIEIFEQILKVLEKGL